MACVWLLEMIDAAKQRCLSRPARADDREFLSAPYLKIDPFQNLKRAEPFVKTYYFDEGMVDCARLDCGLIGGSCVAPIKHGQYP